MTGEDLMIKFNERWGLVRRFIAAHPLTGAWCFFGAGLLIGRVLL